MVRTQAPVSHTEKLQGSPIRSGIDKGGSLLILTNTVLDVLARETRQEKEMKHAINGKEEVQSSLFTCDFILYMEKPKPSTTNDYNQYSM